MKQIILWLIVLGLSGFSSARAANPDNCYWRSGGSEHQDAMVRMPAKVNIKVVGVGQVMANATASVSAPSIVWSSAKCPSPPITDLRLNFDMAPGSALQLENGYTDVYATGLKGVGVRLKLHNRAIPWKLSSKNGNASSSGISTILDLEFVRTGSVVNVGTLNLNFKITFQLNDWHAVTMHAINAVTEVETDTYFNGCAGLKKDLHVSLGKTWSGHLQGNAVRTAAFDMDVRCTGLPAGSKLPVKIYFEGDSPGDGRLNLVAGGVTDVEISLLNTQGAQLPFSQAWTGCEVCWRGDLHPPIRGRYIQKANTPITEGKADAVLNYIIEYN